MRTAVIGADRGFAHARWLAQCPEFAVTAVACPQDIGTAAKLAALHHPDADVTDDAAALIRRGRIDAVVIASASQNREALVTAALHQGLLVVCEPPLTADRQTALALAELAHTKNADAFVSFQWRESPPLRHARRVVADGSVGELLTVDLELHDTPKGPSPSVPRREQDDGALSELGVHALDLLPWFSGIGSWEVTSAWWQRLPGRPHSARGVGGGRPDDIAQVELLSLLSTVRARVVVGRTGAVRPRLAFTALGTRGVLRVTADPADGSGLCTLSTGTRDAQDLFPPDPMNPYHRLARDLATGARTAADFDDGLAAQNLVDAALRAGHGSWYGKERHVPDHS